MNIRPPRRGVMLVEVVMALGLFTVFVTVSGQLYRSSLMSMDGAAAADAGASGIDHALAAMRRDVWASKAVAVEAASLVLSEAGGRQVKWSTEDGVLTREERLRDAQVDTRSWRKLPPLTWEINGPIVIVTARVTGRGERERADMVAPLLAPALKSEDRQ